MTEAISNTTADMHRASSRRRVTMSRLHKAGLEKPTHSGGTSSSPIGCSNARCCSVGLKSSLESLQYAISPLACYYQNDADNMT